MKRALITGSEGFAGNHLWKELEQNGYEVFGTTLHEPSAEMQNNIFHCDISVKQNIKEVVDNLLPDCIFNLAAIASPSYSFKNPELTIQVNTIGVINLLEVVKEIPEYKPKILLVGSSEEYGVISSEDMPVKEDHSLNPVSPYSASKVASYHLAKIYSRSYGMDIVYACSFNNTGPGQQPGFLAPDVASQIVKIERGKQSPAVLTGNLDTYRDYTDVRDTVRAYRLLMEKGESGQRYNVCSGISVSTKSIVEKLISMSSVGITQEVDQARNRPSDMPIIKGSYKKLNELTGWKPEIPLEKTLKDLLDWHRTDK